MEYFYFCLSRMNFANTGHHSGHLSSVSLFSLNLNFFMILLQGECKSYFSLKQIPGTDKFAKVIEFLRRQLHRDTLVSDLSFVS